MISRLLRKIGGVCPCAGSPKEKGHVVGRRWCRWARGGVDGGRSDFLNDNPQKVLDGMGWGHWLPPPLAGKPGCPNKSQNASPGFLGQPSSKWQDPVALVRRRLSRSGDGDARRWRWALQGVLQLQVLPGCCCCELGVPGNRLYPAVTTKTIARKRTTVIWLGRQSGAKNRIDKSLLALLMPLFSSLLSFVALSDGFGLKR